MIIYYEYSDKKNQKKEALMLRKMFLSIAVVKTSLGYNVPKPQKRN